MMLSILYWVSQVLATFAAIPTMYFGLAYIVPAVNPHLNAYFKDYYENVISLIVGWPGALSKFLRPLIGSAQVAAGAGTLLALWGGLLGLFTSDWFAALLLCAMWGMIVVDGVG